MREPWASKIIEIPVKRAPLGANRSDSNGVEKRIAIIHDIEGSASSALGLFASPGPPGVGGGSTQFVADPAKGCFWQLVSQSDVAYGCGNYPFNRAANQLEMPGFAGQPYAADVLDYAARWLAYQYLEFGVPLVFRDLAYWQKNPNGNGVTGHQFIPNPDNPSQGGGKDGHTDPGPTFPWNDVLVKARNYAGLPPLNGEPNPGTGVERTQWPTGFYIGPGFGGYWESIGGTYSTPGTSAPIAIFGYPISRQFVDEGQNPHLVCQYFERARFEKGPDGVIRLGLVGSEVLAQHRLYLPQEVITKEY